MKSKDKSDGIILRDHTYDGIQEFDQKLPNWWLFTLYIAIVAFVVYWVAYYNLPTGMKSDLERIEIASAKLEQKRAEQLAAVVGSLDHQSLFEMSREEANLTEGKAIYEGKCAACHGVALDAMAGSLKLPGVALDDAEWLYGSQPMDIMKMVTHGSPDKSKGMIAWKTQLNPSQIAQVVAYVLSKQPGSYDPMTQTGKQPDYKIE